MEAGCVQRKASALVLCHGHTGFISFVLASTMLWKF